MPKTPHVALLIETSREVGRGILRGVTRCVREHGPWSVFFRPVGLEQAPPPWLKTWRGDGILARIDSRRMADAVLASGVPAIDLRGSIKELGLPHVGVDNRAVVQLAYEHLVDRGFRNLAFCGMPRGQNHFNDLRGELFEQLAKQAGCPADVFRVGRKGHRETTWEREQDRIADWVAGLPKPVGIMCVFDDRGLQVLDACRRANVRVPDDVAVLSIDNDEYLCRLADPPLTSIDVNPERIGYEAAALLERMMAGSAPPAKPIEIEPRGIVARHSSDVLAIEDSEVAAVLRFVRQHACEGINVSQIVNHSTLSRSTLERRFKTLLGRTPKAEVFRVRLDKAKGLLARTDIPVAEVACKSGFISTHYFSEVFHGKVGVPPGEYRRRSRAVS